MSFNSDVVECAVLTDAKDINQKFYSQPSFICKQISKIAIPIIIAVGAALASATMFFAMPLLSQVGLIVVSIGILGALAYSTAKVASKIKTISDQKKHNKFEQAVEARAMKEKIKEGKLVSLIQKEVEKMKNFRKEIRKEIVRIIKEEIKKQEENEFPTMVD